MEKSKRALLLAAPFQVTGGALREIRAAVGMPKATGAGWPAR